MAPSENSSKHIRKKNQLYKHTNRVEKVQTLPNLIHETRVILRLPIPTRGNCITKIKEDYIPMTWEHSPKNP